MRWVVLLVALAGCASARSAPTTTPSSAHLSALPMPDLSRDMQRASGGHLQTCDYRTPPATLAERFAAVGTAGDPKVAMLATVDDIAPAQWNTSDGQKPTQAQADAMATAPGIYRRVRLRVTKVYAGPGTVGLVTGWAHYGTIGSDSWSDCTFPSAARDVVWDGSPFVAGREFVVFFDEAGTIQDLLSVDGTTVVNHGESEPLP